jgi:cephalosporin hydroxylase
MKIVIDTDTGRLMAAGPEGVRDLPLYSKDGFDVLSRLWMKVGWNQNFQSSFTWCGQPILELRADLLFTQEVVNCVRPNVIIQTGLAHSGLFLLLASMLRSHGGGKVIGVDANIPLELRQALDATDLASDLTLLRGEIVAESTLTQLKQTIIEDARVMAILASNRSKAAVRDELEAYAPLVSVGSYLVATGGFLQDVHDVPRGNPQWKDDHPAAAALEFALEHAEFRLEEFDAPLQDKRRATTVTFWPQAWLRRVK